MKYVDETTTKNIIEFVLASGNKRLVPMFVSSLDVFDEMFYQSILDDNNIPIICLSVGNHDSIFMENQIDRQFQYILGAGDDEEMWSNGLTSKLFWQNPELYLNCKDNVMIKNIIIIV
jgi:tRNA A64-2'-O-ribosylphosphate transferase